MYPDHDLNTCMIASAEVTLAMSLVLTERVEAAGSLWVDRLQHSELQLVLNLKS